MAGHHEFSVKGPLENDDKTGVNKREITDILDVQIDELCERWFIADSIQHFDQRDDREIQPSTSPFYDWNCFKISTKYRNKVIQALEPISKLDFPCHLRRTRYYLSWPCV